MRRALFRMSPKQDQSHMAVGGCGHFLGDRTKGLSYVQPRGTTARGGLVFRHADDQVVEHLGYPTRQCLERWLAADPGHAGHMAKPIIPLETRTKAIELVLDGMRGSGPPNGSARASARSATESRRIARAAWPRCGPKTGTPARPTSLRRDEAEMPGPSVMTWRRCAAGSRSWNWRTR